MFIIAGLGNPGLKYAGTRHNVGFGAIDLLAEKYGIGVDAKKHKALIGKGVIDGQKVVLVKPQTYMNLSGESIQAAAAGTMNILPRTNWARSTTYSYIPSGSTTESVPCCAAKPGIWN